MSFVLLFKQISQCRGQCYDGAAVMAGGRSGVATRILAICDRALFIHCCSHSLNLAVQDSCRHVNMVRDLLELTKNIVNFIHSSPKRCRLFDRLKSELPAIGYDRVGLRPLCPTRFTMRANSLASIKSNFDTVIDVLESISCNSGDDSAATASGLLKQMESFDFVFSLEFALPVLSETDSLSKLTQSTKMAAWEIKKAAILVADSIARRRTDEVFSRHFDNAKSDCVKRGIPEPVLRRVSKRPVRYEEGLAAPTVMTIETHYKRIFFDFLDRVVNTIRGRFDQTGFRMLDIIERVLLAASKSPSFSLEDVKSLCEFYGNDFDQVSEG